MEKQDMPLWFFLAFSSLEMRKGALILIYSSIVFTLYCIPWSLFFKHKWIATLFLLNDWSWAAMMVPIVLWYWLSLRWVDKHDYWKKNAVK
jgi:hypothetical protein